MGARTQKCGALEVYASEQDFLDDLQLVFQEDYDTLVEGEALIEAGRNVDALLNTFIS